MDKKENVIQNLVLQGKCIIRLYLNEENSYTNWSHFLMFPVPGYIEVGAPVAYSEVRHFELYCLMQEQLGRIMPIKNVNHLLEVKDLLDSAGIRSEQTEEYILRVDICELMQEKC